MEKLYYHLTSVSLDASLEVISPPDRGRGDRRFCQTCFNVLKRDEPIDIRIDALRPRTRHFDVTELWDVNVIHTSLLDLLGREHVERDLLLGTVTNKKGHVVEGWHTVIGRERLNLRGKPHFWKGKAMFGAGCCKECGILHYHAPAPRYLCPGPTSDRVIRQSDTTCLIIPASLKEAINLKRGSGYALEKLPVLESPRDGMPVELSCEPGERIETTLTG